MNASQPAWTRESMVLQLSELASVETLSPEWALGGATGAGIRVAVIDSGVDADHPQLAGAVDVDGAVDFSVGDDGDVVRTDGPHGDVFGHGTACAGIIHALAPEARITSVRVLGPGLRGKAAAFYAGLTWAVENRFDVINLSLGAGKRDWALPFHEVCDQAYFNNCFIVTAANNIKRVSFPSLYAAVTSVACNTATDPLRFHFNPEPPTDFLARGIDVEVPWTNGGTTVTTGNSFAAPHIAGFAALIKSKHPTLRPFHVKAGLWACSANVREASGDTEAAGRSTAVQSPALSRRTVVMGADGVVIEPKPVQRGTVALGASGIAAKVSSVVVSSGSVPASEVSSEAQELAAALPDLRIGELIARGPLGPVYAATVDSRELAVRRLDPALADDPQLLERFVASVRKAATLDHPNIVPIEQLVETERFAVLVMPRSKTNAAELTTPLEPAWACTIAQAALAGLDAAHRQGVFHGDLRRANLLIDGSDVRLSDVGLAAALTGSSHLDPASDPSGWSTLAPEQLSGGAVAAYTDVHAVGLVLFELLSGSLPFDPVNTFVELLRQRGGQQPRTLASVAPSLDPRLCAVVEKAVANRPPDRYLSALEFSQALGAFL